MALSTPAKRLNPSKHAAPSRPFPNVPDAHATAAKMYLAVLTVPAADDASAGDPVVQWLLPPAAHATDDKVYTLQITVTGDDTTGGSTVVPVWTETTADLTP